MAPRPYEPLARALALALLASASALAFAGCGDDDDGDDPEPVLAAPTGDFTFEQDPDNPRLYTFTAVDLDPGDARVAWDFGHSDPGNTATGTTAATTFPSTPGDTVAYVVAMTLTRATGISDPTTVRDTITVALPAERVLSDREAILVGGTEPGSSKSWAIGKNVKGHNRALTPSRFIWARDPLQMECLGVYDDVYTFSFDGDSLFLDVDYGGELYVRGNGAGTADRYTDIAFVAELEGCASGLSGADGVTQQADNYRTTWSLGEGADGDVVLAIGEGYLHLDAGQFPEYTFLSGVGGVVDDGFQADSLWLRTYQTDSVVVWDMLLVPLDRVDEGGPPPFACDLSAFGFDLADLHGGSEKTWRYASEEDGYSAAYRPNGEPFWEREAGALECLGLDNDRFTFGSDGSFVADFGGDIYARAGLFDTVALTNVRTTAEANCPDGLSGADRVADYTSPTGLTYETGFTNDAATETCASTLTLSEGGLLAFAVGQTGYTIEALTSERLVVRAAQPDGAVLWQATLVPAGG